MKRSYHILTAVVLMLTANLAYASYDSHCLDDCFKTHHECNYCAYACRVDDAYTIKPYEPDQPKCVLEERRY